MALSTARCVLVAFGEALAAPEACYSLVDAGFRVVAACRRGSHSALRHSRLIQFRDVTPPEDDIHEASQDLVELAREVGAVAVLPLDDAALWFVHQLRERFPCPVATAPAGAVEVALDKRLQIEAAQQAGFAVPPSRFLLNGASPEGWKDYPAILKGSLAARRQGPGLGRGGFAFCKNATALAKATAALSPEDPMVLQSWQQGTGVGVFGFRTDQGVRAWSGHHRVRMMNPAGSGSSCCESEAPSAASRAHVGRFLEHIGWRGLFMVELLRDADGREWFMELNGRVWGSLALSRAIGLEYPAWAVLDALGELPDLPLEKAQPGRRARHLGREIVHMLLALRGPGRHKGMVWPGRLSTIAKMCGRNPGARWYNARRGDMGVFRADVMATLRSQVLRRRRP